MSYVAASSGRKSFATLSGPRKLQWVFEAASAHPNSSRSKWKSDMAGRTTRISVTFSQPFSLPDIDGIQPAGTYRVQTVDVSLDNLSFLAYRRISTTIELPGVGTASSRRQVINIDPRELEAALTRDRAGAPIPWGSESSA
jgi:hypothetical protein